MNEFAQKKKSPQTFSSVWFNIASNIWTNECDEEYNTHHMSHVCGVYICGALISLTQRQTARHPFSRSPKVANTYTHLNSIRPNAAAAPRSRPLVGGGGGI